MEWYSILFLVLWILTLIGFGLYWLLKPTNKSLKEVKNQLRLKEEDYKKLKNKFVAQGVEKKNLEKQLIEKHLKELEAKYRYDLATLGEKEKKEYEKVKSNPQDGIDYIKSLISDK